jgi:hypothetical protein
LPRPSSKIFTFSFFRHFGANRLDGDRSEGSAVSIDPRCAQSEPAAAESTVGFIGPDCSDAAGAMQKNEAAMQKRLTHFDLSWMVAAHGLETHPGCDSK